MMSSKVELRAEVKDIVSRTREPWTPEAEGQRQWGVKRVDVSFRQEGIGQGWWLSLPEVRDLWPLSLWVQD